MVIAHCTEFWGQSFTHGLPEAKPQLQARAGPGKVILKVGAGEGGSVAFICPHQGKKAGQVARLLPQERDKGPQELTVEMEAE